MCELLSLGCWWLFLHCADATFLKDKYVNCCCLCFQQMCELLYIGCWWLYVQYADRYGIESGRVVKTMVLYHSVVHSLLLLSLIL